MLVLLERAFERFPFLVLFPFSIVAFVVAPIAVDKDVVVMVQAVIQKHSSGGVLEKRYF